MTARWHLLDGVLDFIANAHREMPFALACGCFAAVSLGVILIFWGVRLDIRDQQRAERAGEA